MEDHGHTLWDFPGGLHLDAHKAQSTEHPLERMSMPKRLVVPLRQHIGEATRPLVTVGDRVRKGQLIGTAEDYVGAPVHAPACGVVRAVEDRPSAHPSGLDSPCVLIETDGDDRCTEPPLTPLQDYHNVAPAELRQRVREAGIVGLGGATFPSAVKLEPPPRHEIQTLILNGAECEPYISCDDTLMRARPAAIVEGLRIMRRVLGVERGLIGLEDNLPQAFAALCEALGGEEAGGIRIVQVPTRYPVGGERQLLKVLTGLEVPSGGLPGDIGLLCFNVATAEAVYRAVVHGAPLTSRVVTVTGAGVRSPCNLEVPLGACIADVVAACGGYTEAAHRLIVGGPMMGLALPSDALPVTKGTDCILAASRAEVGEPARAMPCIRCGECARVCPAQLLPQELYWHAKARDFDKAQAYDLFDCIECGACAYVCPSNLPLVHYYRFAKTEIWGEEHDRHTAEIARRRHERRSERLGRDEREQAERLARREAILAGDANSGEQDSQPGAIRAAVERAKTNKATKRSADKERESSDRE